MQSVQTSKRYAHLPRLEAHEVGRPKFRLRNPIASGLGDFIVQPIWDYYGAAVGTPVVLQRLFTIPQGQNVTITGGATFAKTPQTTTMTLNAQLEAPQRLLVRAVSVLLDNQVHQNDLTQFVNQTLLIWNISTKAFLTIPVVKCPAGGGAWSMSIQGAPGTAVAIGSTITNNGNGFPTALDGYSVVAPGAPGFPTIEGVLIEQQQAFNVVLDPTLAAHKQATGFTTAAAAGTAAIPQLGTGIHAFVFLEGTLVRAVL
jgi:hypothetical protein